MFIVRQARAQDRRQILLLARRLHSINLPTESAELEDALARSKKSFAGQMRKRANAVYIFCAEQQGTGKLVGASMIIAKHGTPQSPHYYLEMDSDERYSHTLRKMFRHTYLRLRYSMNGPTEVGGLIVDPKWRGHPEKIGKQLSWVRFLYIGLHRARFESRVLAEMMPPIVGDHGNLFWDHYGRRVTGISFREADRLSTRDKEFIRALFPESPLYTFMLPEEVRASLGAVGKQTQGAVKLLEKAGMRFLNHIDPFDGGPYYGALVSELEPVKQLRRYKLIAGPIPHPGGAPYLLACDHNQRGFRSVKVDALVSDDIMTVEPGVLETLAVKKNTRLPATPIP